jgi:hypothetical protein
MAASFHILTVFCGSNDVDDDGDLITLLSFFLLESLHLSQIVGRTALSQGKEIHPMP